MKWQFSGYGKKSAVRCQTPQCIEAIRKYGESYHDVHPASGDAGVTDACQRCGGVHMADGSWVHECKACGTTVEPGALTGLFVPHSCSPCLKEMTDKERSEGSVCRTCHNPYSLCYC